MLNKKSRKRDFLPLVWGFPKQINTHLETTLIYLLNSIHDIKLKCKQLTSCNEKSIIRTDHHTQGSALSRHAEEHMKTKHLLLIPEDLEEDDRNYEDDMIS